MKRTVVLSVAPVAHMEKQVPRHVKNPVTAEQIARTTIACAKRGASVVHLHVRDNGGRQVGDLGVFSRTIDLIRKESDIVIQGSTGGVSDLDLDRRSVSVEEPRVEMASLNMGSTNFGEGVYVNRYPDIRYWAAKMRRFDVVPELEVFDLSMVETCLEMQRQGVLPSRLHFNFSLGFPGALSATPENLFRLVSALPPGSSWSLLNEGMTDFGLLAVAVGMGASGVRVGYEDGFLLEEGLYGTNEELVERAVTVIRLLGCEVATPTQARTMLEIRKAD